jgi:hypothetical protein
MIDLYCKTELGLALFMFVCVGVIWLVDRVTTWFNNG